MTAFVHPASVRQDLSAETPGTLPSDIQGAALGAPPAVRPPTPSHVSAETSSRDLIVPSGTIPADTEQLGDEIARLAAHIHAATHRFLVLIRAFDEEEGWSGGFLSCAHWLSWRTGIAPGAAREKVRVARALGSLPRLSTAMARGELSYSKVRALTRVASPDNEVELLEIARHATAAHIERLVRVWRRVDRQTDAEEERNRHRSRYVRLHPDEDGMWRLEGRLDPEVGALLEKALDWASDALYRRQRRGGPAGVSDPTEEESVPGVDTNLAEGAPPLGPDCPSFTQRRADALGLLAERWMSVGKEENEAVPASSNATVSGNPTAPEPATPQGRADRFQVVLHVEAEELKQGADGCGAEIGEAGVHVSAETSRRLACDASVVRMTHDAEGNVLDVGRKTRAVPPAIRRALDHRDKGCRFPGCGLRYTDAHHIVHWADGGRTKLENLVLLCRRHHRLVHEGGFTVEWLEGQGNGSHRQEGGIGRRSNHATGCKSSIRSPVRFHTPEGSPIPDVPVPVEVPADPMRALQRENADRSVHPGEWTATPRWNGEVFDLDLALAGVMPLAEPAR